MHVIHDYWQFQYLRCKLLLTTKRPYLQWKQQRVHDRSTILRTIKSSWHILRLWHCHDERIDAIEGFELHELKICPFEAIHIYIYIYILAISAFCQCIPQSSIDDISYTTTLTQPSLRTINNPVGWYEIDIIMAFILSFVAAIING